MRHTISVQTNTDSRDAYGGITNSWATTFTTRASINEVRGGERVGSGQTAADKFLKIVFRVDPSNPVSPQNRILFGSRVFDIESIVDFEERGHFYEAMVIERNT